MQQHDCHPGRLDGGQPWLEQGGVGVAQRKVAVPKARVNLYGQSSFHTGPQQEPQQ